MPSHFLKAGDFRFDMGLRRGSPEYFRNSGPPDLLEERRTFLGTDPGAYAGSGNGAEAMLRETADFARSLGVPVGKDLAAATLATTWFRVEHQALVRLGRAAPSCLGSASTAARWKRRPPPRNSPRP